MWLGWEEGAGRGVYVRFYSLSRRLTCLVEVWVVGFRCLGSLMVWILLRTEFDGGLFEGMSDKEMRIRQSRISPHSSTPRIICITVVAYIHTYYKL